MSNYSQEKERDEHIRRQAWRRWVFIAATGFVLPLVTMWIVWLGLWTVGANPLTRARLGVILTPGFDDLPGFLAVLFLFALPFLVQAVVARRMLSARGKRRQRAEWRTAGFFLGLSVSTVIIFAIVVPTNGQWTEPGLGVPMFLLAYHYGAGLIGGLIGGSIGASIGRKFFGRRRGHMLSD